MVEFEELATGHDHAALVLAIFQVKRQYWLAFIRMSYRGRAFSLRCDCGFSTGSRADICAEEGRGDSDLPPSGRPQYRPA